MSKYLRVVAILLLTSPCILQADASKFRRSPNPVRGEYIVVLQHEVADSVPAVAAKIARSQRGAVRATYDVLLKAFWAEFTEEQALRVAALPEVAWVEENGYVDLATSSPAPRTPLVPGSLSSMWGLDRSDQWQIGSSTRYDDTFEYCSTGAGVRVYVVDTGVMPFHPEFGGSCIGGNCRFPENRINSPRVDPAPSLDQAMGRSAVNGKCWDTGYTKSPTASHGTSVASIIAGNTFGVARGATIVDAQYAPCGGDGTAAQLLQALNWIPNDPNRGGGTAVVNCSFTARSTTSDGNAITAAVNQLSSSGYIVVAAAGNGDGPEGGPIVPQNTFWYTPASASSVITVGASTSADVAWAFSNYSGIELYAPGQYVESASTGIPEMLFNGEDFRYRSKLPDCNNIGYNDTCTSGTSFATPFVAGGVARFLQQSRLGTRDQALTYLQNQSAMHNGVTITSPYGGSAQLFNINDCH